MTKYVHVLRDSVTGNTSELMFVSNLQAFERGIALQLAQSELPVSLVRDSALYLIGTFDTESMEFDSCVPTIVWRGDDLGFAEMVKMASEALRPAASVDSEAPSAE